MTFFNKISVHFKKTSINLLIIEFLHNKLYIIEKAHLCHLPTL